MRALAPGTALIVAIATLLSPGRAAAQERFGVHLFGLSYHYQSRTYQESASERRRYEQTNPGIGAEYIIRDGDRLVVSADAGVYKDSKERGNFFAGPALRARVGSHLMLGGGLVLMTSRTYGVPVAPLPLVTARWSRVAVNATWIPALSRQESGAIGMFTTIYFGRAKRRDRPA
jgi:hypothetical protein